MCVCVCVCSSVCVPVCVGGCVCVWLCVVSRQVSAWVSHRWSGREALVWACHVGAGGVGLGHVALLRAVAGGRGGVLHGGLREVCVMCVCFEQSHAKSFFQFLSGS